MPKIIAVEGHGNLQFGDDWSDDQIDQYIEQNYFGQQPGMTSQAAQPAESQGVWESFTSGFSKGFEAGGIPFYSGGKEAVKSVGVLSAALAAREGTASDEQMQRLREYKAEEERAAAEAESRGALERIAYGVGRVLGEAPGFAGELALTGGVATAGEKAAVKAAAAGVKALGKETAYTATRKAADWAADNVSGRIVRGVAGAAAQTIPSGATRIVSGTAERMTPGFDLEEAPGGTYYTETKQGDPFMSAAYKALGDQFIEVLSERSGGFLTDMLGAGARKAGLGKAIDWTSGLKQAVASRVAQKYPGMFEGNDFLDAVRNTTKWNGVFGEMLEERAGEVGRAALGVQDYQAPSLEQLATEAIGFGLIDAGFNSARLASTLANGRLTKEQRDRTQQALDAVTAAEIIAPPPAATQQQQAAPAGDPTTIDVETVPTAAPVRRAETPRWLDMGLRENRVGTDEASPIDALIQDRISERRAAQNQAGVGAASRLAELEEAQANRYGPGVRGEVPQKIEDAGMDVMLRLLDARQREVADVNREAGSAGSRLSELEENQANRFGPGVRGEVPQRISDAGSDVMAKLRALRQRDAQVLAQIEAEAASRAEAKRLAAEKAAREQAEAQARAAAEKAAAEARAAAEAAAAEEAAKKAAAEKASQPQDQKLLDFIEEVDGESVNLASPSKLRSLVKKAKELGYIDDRAAAEVLRVQKELGSRDDTSDAFDELASFLNAKLRKPSTQTSPPTESSLPVGTGAAPVGGVPVAAPVIVSNGQQKQETAAPSVAPVQPAQTQAAGGTAGAQTAQAQGVANANQVQGPVEVPRGQAPQPAAPLPEGEPGAVQVAPGAQSEVQKPGTQANAPLTAPVYTDGTPIKVEDTVRWRTAAGKNEVLGKVVSIKDGVPQVRITQLSKKAPNTLKIGDIELNGVYPVLNFNLLEKREPVKVSEKKKVGRPSKITQTDDEKVAAILEEGVNHPQWPRFSELMRGALNENEADEDALDALREQVGARASVAMEAAFNLQTAFDFVDGQPSVANLEIEDVLANYERGLKKWVLANIDSKSPVGFSPKKNLVIAARNSRKKSKIEKATILASSSVNEEGEEESPIQNVPAPSTSGASSDILSTIFGDVEALSKAVLSELGRIHGRMMVERRYPDLLFKAAIERAFVSMVPKSNAKAINAASAAAMDVAPNLLQYYFNEDGEADELSLDRVEQAILDREPLMANAAAKNTGTQVLQQGETTLADAIDAVLANKAADHWMRKIAQRLLQARLRARVVVLSDAEFDRLAPRPGQSAFYDAKPQADTIYIRQSAASHDYLVMHEAVHAATVYALRTNVKFRNEVRRLRDAAVKALGANSFYGLQEHGSNFNNLAEFVGESMSSQEFRDALDGVVDTDGQSLWTKFLNLLGRLFGFKGEQKTLLDQIVNLSTEQFAPNTAVTDRLYSQNPTDAAYMDLVARYEAGDESVLQELQRMVDEAAKAAGYTIGPVYHGTDSNTFTVFDRNAPFSDKTVNAASPTSAMNRSRLGFWFSTKPEEAALYGKNILRAWLKGGQVEAMPVSKWARGVPSADSDSIYVEGDMPYTTDQWVVKQPSQIKSADPITRDSNGNVIPLSQRFNPESDSILYAAPQIGSQQQLTDMTSVPGLNAANIAAIENLAATQAQMVPGSIVSQINAATKTVQRSLRWLVDQASASASPKLLSSMPASTEEEVQAKHEAAHAVDKLARDIENERAKVLDRLENVRQAYSASIAGLKSKLASANAQVAATTGVVDNLTDDYKDYVRDTVMTGGTLTVAQKAAYNEAAEIVRRTHKQSDQMRKAMVAIAEGITDSDLSAAQSNDDIINIIASRKLLDGKVLPETITTLFTVGSSGKTPLQSMRRLIPALKLIKKINSNIAAVKASIDGFEKAYAGMTGNKQRKVNPRAFARLYRRVLAKQAEAIEEARLLSNTIDRMERKILRATDELAIYDNLIASPEFTAQHEEAIRNLNILSGNAGEYGGAEGAKSDRKLTYKIGSQLYTLEYSADPAVNANNNATVMSALAAIEAELKKPLSPIDRFKLKWMRTKLTLFSNPMGDAALAINSFDIINRLRVAIPILTPLIDRAYITSLMPGTVGKELRLLLKVSMSVASGIEAARLNPRYGEYAINLAVDNAIKSHPGMDPRTWDKEVLNEFLGSNQERTGRNLKVGDTTAFGHVITKEDVKAAELQARFADAVYKAARGSENGGIAMYYPTLVQESYIVNGEKRLRFRYAYAGGAFTTPMTLDRSELPGRVREMAQRWHNEGKSPSTAYANRLALLQQSKWFVNFALKHVMEMSPLYKRKSPYLKVYQVLADRYASTGKLPGTLDDLIDDIDAMTPSTVDEALRKDEITRQLISEINEFVDSYLTQIEGADRDEEAALLKTDANSAVAFNSVISGSNNFTKPRGEMVAPSNFYNFTVSSDSAKGVLTHAAMMPIRMRQLSLMRDARAAFEAELAKINEQIESRKGSAGYIKREWTEPKSNVLSGKAYLNQGQLMDLVKMINNATDVLQQTLEKPAVGRLQTTLIEDMLQVRRVMLVAQLTSAIMNFTQAVTAGQFVPSIYLQGYKPKSLIKQSLTQIVRGAWDTAAALSSENKAVSGWLKANKAKTRFLLRKFAERVEEFQRMQARSNFEGFAAPRMSVFERARIVRQLGSYDSPVEGFADSKGSTSRALESVFSKWFLPYVTLGIQNIPASVDRVANMINMMAIQDNLNLVMRSGISIMEKRAASGAAGWDNWSDPKNLISEAEADAAGWQRETLVNMRQAFSGLGGLERVLHDYWLRVQAAKAAGTSIDDVPPIADDGFNRDVTRELLGMTNASMEGMRPESIQGRTILGRIYNFIFTFSSWVNRYFSTLGNLSAVDPKRGYINFAAYSALSMAALLTVLAISGAWNNEIRGLFYELVKGRPYPVTRLGDVLRDSTPGSVAKLAAASIGLMVPYAGEAISNMVGGQNYRNSPTDIASFSQTVQLAKTFSSAIESGMKTGDWTGTFVNTLRQTVPGTDSMLNRLPGVKAMDASADAARVARVAAGPLELSDKGGQGGTPTKFSNLVRRAEAAAAAGNLEQAQELLQQAAEEKKKTGGSDPYGAVKSAIAGRNVDRKTFGRNLTDDEREGLLSRMSESQKAAYLKAEETNKTLASLVPAAGSRGDLERVGGKPKSAIDRVNSKLNKIRRSATPKALRAIKTKLSKLKPKKLKISKPRAVSGSRLLRPKAQGAGAFALRPASM